MQSNCLQVRSRCNRSCEIHVLRSFRSRKLAFAGLPDFGPNRRVCARAKLEQAEVVSTEQKDELVVARVSNTGGSRKAFAKVCLSFAQCTQTIVSFHSRPCAKKATGSQAFTTLLGLKLSTPEDLDPETLRNPSFPRYRVPGSDLVVQKLRSYFLGRTYTDTDVRALYHPSRHCMQTIDVCICCLHHKLASSVLNTRNPAYLL